MALRKGLLWRQRRAGFDRNTMVIVLTWAASGVDAISYLGLGHVFTANMTGNAVLLGLAVGQGQGLAALRSIIALAGFIAGAAAGAIVIESSPKHGEWPRAVTLAIAVESMILLLFTIGWHTVGSKGGPLYVLIILKLPDGDALDAHRKRRKATATSGEKVTRREPLSCKNPLVSAAST